MVSLHGTTPDANPPRKIDDVDDPANTLHAVLASPVRRFILRYLADLPEATPLTVLDGALAAAIAGADSEDLTEDQRETAAIALVHVHLPKLVEAGYVTWDGDAVSLTDDAAIEGDLAMLGEDDSDGPADRTDNE